MKDRDHIQYKLEKNVIFQQYLEKVLESAEEVLNNKTIQPTLFVCQYYCALHLGNL